MSTRPGESPDPFDALRAHVEAYPDTDEVAVTARERGHDLGARPVSPATAATLTVLALMLRARTVVEIGTGAGTSGLALLAGMRTDGVLTTIDIEPEHQRAARHAFGRAGFGAARFRLINGRAAEVLPRLTDSGYDLVLVDAAPTEHPGYLAEAARLLRPGGALVVHGALAGARVADPTARDAATVALRETARTVAADERWTPVLLPVGDGLLVAALV